MIFLFAKLTALFCGLALLCRLLRGFTLFCHGGCKLRITTEMSTRLRARHISALKRFYVSLSRVKNFFVRTHAAHVDNSRIAARMQNYSLLTKTISGAFCFLQVIILQ